MTSSISIVGNRTNTFERSGITKLWNRDANVVTIANSTTVYTLFTFDAMEFDEVGGYNGSDLSKIFIPQGTRKCRFGMSLAFNAAAAGFRTGRFRLNGVTTAAGNLGTKREYPPDATTFTANVTFETPWFKVGVASNSGLILAVGDYVQEVALQNSGADLGCGDIASTYFWGEFVF